MAVGDGRVISNFIVQALENTDITIYGDGSQTRSFCFVDDLILGMTKVFFHEANVNSRVNLGNPVEFSMVELAERIMKLSGSSSKLVNKPLPQDDPKQRKPDIELAMETFGWSPTITLDQGLQRTISYFKNCI
jgi:UDP-glucuronate decarboxylase